MSNDEILYPDVQSVRSAFVAGNLTAQETADLLASGIRKPWHTKEWILLRRSLINDECAQCGSSDGPFVLQHTWQPHKLSEITHVLRSYIRPMYEANYPVPQIKKPIPEGIRNACPKCHLLSLYYRKTSDDWRCGNKWCRNIFNRPVAIEVLTPEQDKVWRAKQKIAKHKWYECFRESTEEYILSEALKIGFQEHDRYISCKDTTTYCKKCAFMWDRNRRKICDGCKQFVPIWITPLECWNCLDEYIGFGSTDQD